MTRELAASTLERLSRRLADERARLETIIRDHEREREESKLAEAAADRSADPDNVDGGAIEVEMEMDLAMIQNARDLLEEAPPSASRISASPSIASSFARIGLSPLAARASTLGSSRETARRETRLPTPPSPVSRPK